ncbi:DUF397 domain-containing protein [Actinomadura sp. NBRC 104412]|uniref:DUF397 domain-containing protein n=1 Tax=Actinomadura sp. NBRC 104412 TaxID=3032203 RepID=UPI0024A24E54|nr:DUF397 domain-containing protein [Actinomadura sp. NBRC 104412]GLZ09624.1 DUF397 domain-containing protein [Actinomadura sp. NBRC 104412]
MTGAGAAASQTVWRKSSHSGGGNQCVEVAPVGATRAVRDSKDPGGGRLAFGVDAFKSFVVLVKQGEYDL